MKILDKNFFNQPAEKVAQELLGKILVRKINGKILKGIITEVEAYIGPNDKASHAYKGKTERNKVMFNEAGYCYIYFIYGMYWMLNIVTGKKNWPAAVLIRGIKAQETNGQYLINLDGPGKLTKFFKIDKKLNGKLATPKNGLWFEDSDIKFNKSKIRKFPRIGVDYAGPFWSKKLLRFKIFI